MQEKASSASFALLGLTYLQPSSHVPATVPHVLVGKDENNVIPADTRNLDSQAVGQKKRLCRHWDTV